MSGEGLDEPIMISALQHYSYCPRQCALIHIEQTFEENLYTLRGQAVHKQVDIPTTLQKGVGHIERALPIHSVRLGLVGRADLIEFDQLGIPYPVEYKHGPQRVKEHDDIQLAAQALCLEEMTGKSVLRGAIYHHSSHHRREVVISEALRYQVVEITKLVRNLFISKQLPPPVNDKRCTNCSLIDSCQPSVLTAQSKLKLLRQQLFNPD